MELSPATCYRAVLARDARYDGRFFTCVKTTGIYCRPICPARAPKFDNCVFLPTAAAAHEAGFRPCLRCRPESAPDLGAWRGTSATVSRALALIEGGALDSASVDALAERLGMGERQLRRLFQQHVGATPVSVAQTRRVLLAKQLIHQTDLTMTQVALASGFGSIRRFNEIFQQLYRRPPGNLRQRRAPDGGAVAALRLYLPYRPPYDWPSMLHFLATRAMTGVERVAADRYSRTIELDGAAGWISVGHAPARSALDVEVRFPRLDALPAIIARVRRMFDLAADPAAIDAGLSHDPALAVLVAARPGLRVPGAWDGFETAVRAVLGQQISVAAATRLAGRLVEALGRRLDADLASQGMTHLFPPPQAFADGALGTLGLISARAAALAGIAEAVLADPRLFDPRADLETAIRRLRALAGLGEWTAHYIAMRVLRENDAFLAADVALQRALTVAGRRPDAKALLARAETWRPWRAYAVLHLWTALSLDAAPTIPMENSHAVAA
jgi:AraC family transcriptional regulator of adaptative response / DNA-3-methyladenine glycosylase II